MPGFPVHHKHLELVQTHVHRHGVDEFIDSLSPQVQTHAIQSSHPLVVPFSSCLQSFPASGSFPKSQFFTSGGQSIGVSALASVPPMISFRMHWLDLPAVQGILKSLLQHHSSKASILCGSAFFMVQLSHPYMITGKTILLTRWTFAGKVRSLLFNMLSRLVIAFLLRGKRFFNFMAAVTICSDFGAPQNKVSHCFHCFPIYLPGSDGIRCQDLTFLNVKF